MKKLKQLTDAQAWAVLRVVFDRRRGICLTLDQFHDVGLYSVGRYGSNANAITKALKAYDKLHCGGHGGWLWEVDAVDADEARLAFIDEQRRNLRRASRKKARKR